MENVLGVASQGIDRDDPDTVLSLLSVAFTPAEPPGGHVVLTLAGDGAIRAEVEALEIAAARRHPPLRGTVPEGAAAPRLSAAAPLEPPRAAGYVRAQRSHAMPVFLDTTAPDFEAGFAALLSAKREESADVDDAVAAIIADVRARGDAALLELTDRFDRLALAPDGLRLSAFGVRRRLRRGAGGGAGGARDGGGAHPRLPHSPDAAGCALDRRGWRHPGLALAAGRAAGLYVPGGQASYPSSVLMNAIPAKVAGVSRLAICVPTPDGIVNPAVMLAARIAEVDEDLPGGRRAGHRRAGLRHRQYRAGGQDHRPGQRLCRRGQAAGLRAGRHRHDRRPFGDPRDRRRRQRSRLDRARSAEPGRA